MHGTFIQVMFVLESTTSVKIQIKIKLNLIKAEGPRWSLALLL